MIIIMDESGLLVITRSVKGGVLVYADYTTAITDCPLKMKALIAIMVNYCLKYDIIINANKTKWLKLGEPVKYDENGKPKVVQASADEHFVINGIEVEKVDRFKLLGNWTMSNGSAMEHIKKRKTAAYSAITGLDELGFNDKKTDLKIKGTLIQTYIRPRLM